ncbi:MAG: hypothetical protein H7Y38_02240 [Armatimonadetes bacterium]|nr:hypothetical protein [Armatimonadota bacterium]
MLQTKTRPFTAAERERLEAELVEAVADPKPNYEEAFGVGGMCAFFGLLLSLPIIGAAVVLGLTGYWLFVIAGVSALIGFAWGFRDGFVESAWQVQARKEHAATLATRLGRGEIEETTVTASAVAHVTDGDEVDGYFFDIGDNRILFLWSMDAWDDTSDEAQLSTAFTFTRFNDDSSTLYSLVKTGESLAPVRELAFASADWSDTFYSGAVFENVSLATLETDLPYLTVAPDEPNA